MRFTGNTCTTFQQPVRYNKPVELKTFRTFGSKHYEQYRGITDSSKESIKVPTEVLCNKVKAIKNCTYPVCRSLIKVAKNARRIHGLDSFA